MESAEKKPGPKPEKNDDVKYLILLYPNGGESPFLKQVRETMQSDTSIRIHDAQSANDAVQQLQTSGHALMVFCVRNKEDLALVLNTMTALSAQIKLKTLRVIGVSELYHDQIPPLLTKRGCADIFSPKLPPKALRHKINQALRIVATTATYNTPPSQADSAAKATAATQGAKAPVVNIALRKAPALTLASDCWLVRKERDLRRVQGRWIVDLIGPGPSAGTWEHVEGRETVWEWKPKALADGSVSEKDFIKDEGTWIYTGRKPDFVWDIGRWRFVGDEMDLSFKKGAEVLACRFRMVDAGLEYADNSQHAKQKLPLIIKTIENEVHFHAENKAKPLSTAKIKDEKKQAPSSTKEFEADGVATERGLLNWEKDSNDGALPDPQLDLGKAPEGPALDLRLARPEEKDGPDLYAVAEAPEETPFNQAPPPKLTVWIAPAQPRDGERFRPIQANPIELSEKHLVLEVPSGHFKAGETVILVMDDGLMKDSSKSRVKCSLIGVETYEQTDTVTLEADAGVMKVLQPIQKVFEGRQEEIVNFLKAARGW